MNTSFDRFLRAGFVVAVFVLILSGHTTKVRGQQPAARPDRGAMPGASYSVSDIESISMVNGNLHLSIPLASLPPIAGGKLKLGISAVYNSKLWNSTRTEYQLPPLGNCANWVVNSPQLSELGGWTITAGYRIEVRDAHEDFNYVVPDAPPAQTCETDTAEQQRVQYNYYKTILISPDGAEHELRPTDTNNYYGTNGGTRSYLFNYYKDTPNTTNAPMRYYSFDGSFLYAVINPSSYSTKWTVYMNDGTRVTSDNNGQHIVDTNGNSIKIVGYTLTDEQTGREIQYGYVAGNNGDGQGTVSYQTVDGTWEHIYLNFGTTTVQGKVYHVDDWNPNGGETGGGTPCFHDQLMPGSNGTEVSVIRGIGFPVTEPGQPGRKFSFEYNSDATESATDSVRWSCGTSPQNYTRTVSHGMGELSEMTTPSGAVVAYEYSRDGADRFLDLDDFARSVITEKQVTHDGVTNTWTYSIDEVGGGGLVTAPDGSTNSETCYALNAGTAMFSGDGKGGLVYRSNRSNKEMVERHWILMAFDGANTGPAGSNSGFVTFNPVVDAEYTSLLDGNGDPLEMSAKTYSYDYNGNLLTTTEYDWFDPTGIPRDAQGVPTGVPSGATMLRTTSNDFYNGASGSSSSNVYAKRSLSTSTPLILSALQQSTTDPAIARLSYDGNSYGTAPTVGNLTGKSVWDDIDSKWITTSQTYDSYGNVATATDARGKVTEFVYDSSTHAQPTSIIVDPQNNTGTQTTSTVYDYSTGLVRNVTDPNGQISTIDYTNQLLNAVDPFGRPGITKSPAVTVDGRSQQHFVATTYEDHLLRVTVATDLYAENDKLLKTRTTADMLGRPILSEQTEDGTNYTIYALKVYDTVNGISYSSGPMKGTPTNPTSSSTDSWTRVTNDILGRPKEVSAFAGATQPPATGTAGVTGFTGTVTTVYDANFTTVTDQAGKVRRSKVDGLGRLVRIDEPNDSGSLGTTSSPNQDTNYEYDVFGNLTTVTQGSQTPRTFTYDSLSRLRSAANPESGTITYTYDDNGNLTQKIDPRLLADNVTHVTTSYVYDALNRATSRSYNDGTPTVTYAYDTLTQNGKGRLASVSSSVSTYSYSGYDATGKVQGGSQTIYSQSVNQTYSLSYKYDLAGHVVSITYPSQRVVNYNYDNAGRLADKDSTHLAFTGNLGDGTTRTYAKGTSYGPMGQMTQEQFGTTPAAVYNKLFYNSRGQLSEVLAATSGNDTTFNRGKIVNDYGTTDNNGNLKQQTVYIPNNDQNTSPASWYQQYDYDSLNRLKRVHEYTGNTSLNWQQEYDYDRYGNRTINYNNTTNGIPRPQFTVSTSNNRLGVPNGQSGTMTYDSAGNLTTDTYSAGAITRLYDAENRMTQETQAGSYVAGTYSYDGDGRRVKRNVGGVETWQVYGIGGELVAEYAPAGSPTNPQKEYGYRNGQLLITTETGTASAAAPSALTATPATSGANVTLNWSAASGATSYRVERKGAGGSFSSIGTTSSTTITDSGASNGSAYLYKVCAADGSGNCTSAYSNVVLGARFNFPTDLTITTFADDPTGLNVTPMKLEHITELRTAVNAVRSLAGLSVATWARPTLTRYVSEINKDDVQELRTKLDEALTTLGIQTSTYEDSTLAGAPTGTTIKGAHIRQLRTRATSGVGSSGGSGGTSFNIDWLISDQLGTPRMIFDQSGSLTIVDQNGNYVSGMTRHDYLPFGEELSSVVGRRSSSQGYTWSDNVRQKFTQKERDSETGLDYFGARYYSSTQGRFISADEPFADQRQSNPQSWNSYSYVRNSPCNNVDPNGKCSAPSALAPGSVGICIEAFIAAPRIGPGGVGRGDGRTFSGDDPSLTARIRIELIITPESRGTASIQEFTHAEKSKVDAPGVLGDFPISAQGTAKTEITGAKTDKNGTTTFTSTTTGENGFASIPVVGKAVPKGSIDVKLNVVVTKDGKVGLAEGSERKNYPSYAVYSYRYDEKGKLITTRIQELKEGRLKDLTGQMVPIPKVEPR